MKKYIFPSLILFSVAIAFLSADPIAPPTNLSLKGLAQWCETGGHISSGTGALPAVASAGHRYTDLSTPTTPLDYISVGGAWQEISGAGGGVSTHSDLLGLEFPAGHTGFASAALLASDVASLAAHIASSTDPHGANETITGTLTVGSGTIDCSISRLKTGTIVIASYTQIPPETATPESPVSGEIWNDANLNKVRIYDGSIWHNLW